MTLSHCWGGLLKAKLLRSNYESYLVNIPLKDLPKTYLDAIYIAGRAGINYLWIDSLCIVQDSPGDWARESAMMGSIYVHGYCNIAATGFANGVHGLYTTRNPRLVEPIGVVMPEECYCLNDETLGYVDEGRYLLVDLDMWIDGVDKAPMGQRGWCVQERRLSPRTIHFGSKQLFWECAEVNACELWPDGFPSMMPISNMKELTKFKPTATGPAEGTLRFEDSNARWGPPEHHLRWREVVSHYSPCQLTFPSDKLVAISGLAKRLKDNMNCPYHAGLWEDQLIHQLGWYVEDPMPAPTVEGCRGPSWSWASVDGSVDIPSWDMNPRVDFTTLLAHITRVETTAVHGGEFGHVRGGNVKVYGSLGVIKLCGDWDPPGWGGTEGDIAVSISWDTSELVKRYRVCAQSRLGRGTYPTTAVRKHVSYGISWENREEHLNEHGIIEQDRADIFLLPLKVMARDIGDHGYVPQITLTGLLLWPTGTRGQFRRVGQLEAVEQLEEGGSVLKMFKELKTATLGLKEKYYEEADDQGHFIFSII
jgi:hypothetical protein